MKFYKILILNSIFFVHLLANENLINKNLTNEIKCKSVFSDMLLKFKPAYFYVKGSNFQKIYKKGGFIAIFGLDCPIYKRWNFWIDAGYFSKKGKIESKIYIIPVSLGIKYLFPLYDCGFIYMKAGPNLMHVKNRFYSNSKIENIIGGTFGLGYLFDIYKGWTGSIFTEYLYDKKKIKGEKPFNLQNHFIIGGGLGYRF